MNRQRQREREIQRQRERQQNDMMTERENYFFITAGVVKFYPGYFFGSGYFLLATGLTLLNART